MGDPRSPVSSQYCSKPEEVQLVLFLIEGIHVDHTFAVGDSVHCIIMKETYCCVVNE